MANPTVVVKNSTLNNTPLDIFYKMMICRAAAYCLQKSYGQKPVGSITVSDSQYAAKKLALDWDMIPAHQLADAEAAYADRKEAVEYAAYAVSLAYLATIHGVTAIARTASTGNGFDFYLNSQLTNGSTVSGKLHRLEVSGIFCGRSKFWTRLVHKLRQGTKIKTSGKAWASVVEFSEPKIGLRYREFK